MINRNASNWVDRGQPAGPELERVLAYHLGLDLTDPSLHEYAVTVLGMVDADASEKQMSSYIGYLEEQLGRPRSSGPVRRLLAIALWHIGKAANTRDRAMRMFREGVPDATSKTEHLSEWLAERILPPDDPK
jgi:hypothetical protein